MQMADVKRVQIDGIINDIVGKGMPSGGSAGQVLKKASGSDYDTEWGTAAAEITVDDEINGTSTNPVQNRVIAQALNDVESVANSKIPLPSDPEDGEYLRYDSNAEAWVAADLPISAVLQTQSDDSVPSSNLLYQTYQSLNGDIMNKVPQPQNVVDGIGYVACSGNGTFMQAYTTYQKADTTLSLSGRIADAKATGDALALKADAADVHSIPAGGGEGQILRKLSTDDYDVYWGNVPGGGGGTSDYSDLTNKPSINSVELSGNKTAAQLSLATASDVASKYTKPSTGIPKSDLASAVQTSLGKADTAIQAPSSPATGAFLVYNGSAWVAQTLATWQASSY